jgi:hypothetical protein
MRSPTPIFAERDMILVDAHAGEEAEPVIVDRAMERRLDSEDFVLTAGPAAMRARYPHNYNGSSAESE